MKILLTILMMQICFICTTEAQILNYEDKISVTLKDGTTVVMFGRAKSMSDELTREYYNLPCNLRLAENKDGTPQFLFLKYTTNETIEQGGINGGLLHLLMEYGLTSDQEKELKKILKKDHDDAVFKGPADVRPDGENSFRVISASLSSNESKLYLNGKAPVLPGSKIAIASIMDKNAAQLLAATFEKTRSIADLSITLSYMYDVRFPAAKGKIIEDWSKLDSLAVIDSAFYSMDVNPDNEGKAAGAIGGGLIGAAIGGPIGLVGGAILGGLFGGNDEKHYSYDEMHDLYEFLQEKEVITLRFEENIADERINQIRDAFFQHFTNRFSERDGAGPPAVPGRKEMSKMPDIKKGNSYKFKREFYEVVKEQRYAEFNLNYSFAVSRSHQITENLMSWYDGVKDNKKCVGVVVLDDPTFEHRDVNVILDLDVEDMMGKELNFVNVMLRKQRDVESANDFNQELVFDKRFFEDNGNRATITYSKAQDDNPEVYEYKVRWSLRGGHEFPNNDTTWIKGSWGGITLAPPVKPVHIRYEVDLDDLKELDIRNVTLQLRYEKFGKETESNLNISLYSEQPYQEETIFLDKNTRGYAYRLIFSHKTEGVLAMPWETKINTNYIFANVPEELRNEDRDFIERAIEAGKEIASVGSDGSVNDKDKVLDKFKDALLLNN